MPVDIDSFPIRRYRLPSFLTLALVALAIFSKDARATNYTFSQTIDVSSLVSNEYDYFSNPPTFTFQAGDTISGTILFANSEVLNLSPNTAYNTYITLTFSSTGPDPEVAPYPELQTSSNLQLLDYTGSGVDSSGFGNGTGAGFNPTILDPVGTGAFSFSGFTYSATIENVSNLPTYAPLRFGISTDSVITVTSAPEPSAWIGILIGMSLLGCSRFARAN